MEGKGRKCGREGKSKRDNGGEVRKKRRKEEEKGRGGDMWESGESQRGREGNVEGKGKGSGEKSKQRKEELGREGRRGDMWKGGEKLKEGGSGEEQTAAEWN